MPPLALQLQESLHLSVPLFAPPWNGVSSDYSPAGTFSDPCLKGCSHWHMAACPWSDRADSINTACHLYLQNGPSVLWDFTSPYIAVLWHPGLSSVLSQLLPSLSLRLGGLPPPSEALLRHHSAVALEWDGCHWEGTGPFTGSGGFCPKGARGQCRCCVLAELMCPGH